MRLLLDSHVWLWALMDPDRLAPEARDAIQDGANRVFVSAASLWEITIKQTDGKLATPQDLLTALDEARMEALPISREHAVVAGRLPLHHRDPFDRMLVAQATVDSLVVVTRDPLFRPYGVPILDA